MAFEAKRENTEKSGRLWLWVGFLLPPIVWAIQLQTVYLLIELGCKTANFMPVHITSAVSLILAIAGGLISWRCWMRAGGEWKSQSADPLARSRFLAILGVLTGALFSLVIFAQWLPTIFGVPCDK